MESEHFLNAQPLLQYFDQSPPSMATCPEGFPRWEKSANRALHFDSIVSSLMSSPAASNSNLSHENLAVRELVGKLGTLNEIPGQLFYNAQQKVNPDVHGMKRYHFQPGLPGFGSRTGEFNPYEPVGNSPEEESTVSGQGAVSRKRKASSKGKAKETDTNNKSDSSKCKPKDDKSAEPPKDYIHVRARRGQATDSHSLAERVRREKISERMKLLQDLVPGCNKVTGKASMLDEIINYVQSLQRQVEFLSMKLASVDTMEALLSKEVTATTTFFQTNPQVPDPVFQMDTILGLQSDELDTFHLLNFDGAHQSFCDGDLQTVVHMGFNTGYALRHEAGTGASPSPIPSPLSNMKIEL